METIDQIIGAMERNLHKAHATGNRFFFGYYAPDQLEKLQALPDPLAGLDAVLGLIERNAEVYFEQHDVPVCPYLESFAGKGLEERLLASLQRQPTACTVYMLDGLMGDTQHPGHRGFVDTMRRIAADPATPAAARQLARSAIDFHDDRTLDRAVHPSNHRTMALQDAIARFDLEALYAGDGSKDALADTVDADTRVIVFEGNTEFTEDVNIGRTQRKLEKVPSGASGFELLLYGESGTCRTGSSS